LKKAGQRSVLFHSLTLKMTQQNFGSAKAPKSSQLVAPEVGLTSLGTLVDAVFALEVERTLLAFILLGS
jgi:hypothetical protein